MFGVFNPTKVIDKNQSLANIYWTRLAPASDKVYHGQWFSRGIPASSTTKTGCHNIAESGAKHNKSNQSDTYITPCKYIQ